jgi:two-component system chemotaxis response regulator CheY
VQALDLRIRLYSTPGCSANTLDGIRTRVPHVSVGLGAEAMGMARILVVDDDRDILDLVSAVLEGAGHAITTAPDGVAALEMLRTMPVDLVLLDWNMPKLSGLEVLQQVRADESLSAMPVALLTAQAQDSWKEQAVAAGVDSYITKPFTMRGLRGVVRTILDQHGIE